MYYLVRYILFITCIFTVNFGYAQLTLPELPNCEGINVSQYSNLDSIISIRNQKTINELQVSFCVFLDASKKAKNRIEKAKIALNANEIGSKLYTKGKFTEVLHFQSLAGQLWLELDSIKQYSKSIRKLGENFHRLGDVYNSLKYLNEARKINKKHSFEYEKYHAYTALAWSYRQVRNFNESEKYILLSKSMIDNKIIIANNYEYYYLNSMVLREKANFTLTMQYSDSVIGISNRVEELRLLALAMKYNDSSIMVAKKIEDIGLLAKAISNKANFLIYIKGDIDSIIKKISYALKINKQMDDSFQLSSNYGILAKAYLYDKNYLKAIETANIALKYAIETGNTYGEVTKYELLKQGYKEKGDYKKAFFYSEKYSTLFKKVYGYRDNNKIFKIQQQHAEELNKNIIINLKNEKKISELKSKQSKQINWLIAIVSLLLLSTILFYFTRVRLTQKRKNELQKEQLSHKLSQMEMDALRSRMNPHFIFNSLNSIKAFIISNDVKSSVSYFSKFAKLLRYSMNNSSINFVSLIDEINFLKDYVALENARLSNLFKFVVELPKDLDIEPLKVPPLIIQPFIENAIWHGLSLIKKDGLLLLKVVSVNNSLEIHIIDNGIGREASKILNKNKIHTSKGVLITEERLEIFSKIYKLEKSFKIIDLKDADGKAKGTEVIIKLPLLYNENNLKREEV